jgi:hypothetical protein
VKKNRFQNLPFKFNLHRYAKGLLRLFDYFYHRGMGLYKLNPVVTHSLKALGFISTLVRL